MRGYANACGGRGCVHGCGGGGGRCLDPIAGNCVAAAGSCGRSLGVGVGVGVGRVTLVQWQVPELMVVTFDCSVQEQLLLLVARCGDDDGLVELPQGRQRGAGLGSIAR